MKILIVGLGSIGQRHVRNLRSFLGDRLQISTVRSQGSPRVFSDSMHVIQGEDVERKYNIIRFKDLETALADDPTAVFITNPSSLHVSIALAAARRGCHLFVEKPLSHSYESVEELITLAERKNLITLVGYQMRFHPCLQRLQTALQQRQIGQILAARVEVGEYLPGWHPYEDYRASYASQHDLGGGVLLSQIHELDYVYWLFGLPQKIFALGGKLSSLDIDVEDIMSILLECVVDGAPVPVHIHQDYVQRPPSRTCQIIGDQGKILIDFLARSIQIFDTTGTSVESLTFPDFQRNKLFLDELSHFLACLKGKESPRVPLREGAQSLRIALAARQSLETGQVVEMEEDGL